MEQIRPSADLRNHYNEISKLCRETRQPVHITVNGRNDTVLLGATDYAQMKTELELLRMLAEAEEDADMMFGEPVPNGNFGVSEEGVTWTFNPYEIAPYALGIIDLTVSWADLKPYLK